MQDKLEKVVSVPIKQKMTFIKEVFSTSYSVSIDLDEKEITDVSLEKEKEHLE